MRKLTKLLSALIVLVLATAFIGCGNPSSSSDGTGGGNNKNAVVAGDIAVSSDDGTTLIYVPADSWNESTYADYTVIGVCVNTSYMINLINERMTWNTADEKYPDTNGWDLPTRVQLKAVYAAMTALNTTLDRIGATTLTDSYYWTSETDNDRVWEVDLYNGNESHTAFKTDSSYVRVVRALD